MQKRKTFRPWQPEQTTLLPLSPVNWLPSNHLVFFLLDLIDELDLSAILIPAQAKDPRREQGRLKVCPDSSCRGCQHWVRSAGLSAPQCPKTSLSQPISPRQMI
jgi:hypothetical protein